MIKKMHRWLRVLWDRYADYFRLLMRDAIWFSVSVLLAVIIWVAATNENDPILKRTYPLKLPVRLVNLAPDVMLINHTISDGKIAGLDAKITVRMAQSVWERLLSDSSNIDVYVDFKDLRSGDYTLPLKANLGLPGKVVDIEPSQVNVRLDVTDQKTVPVQVVITGEPAVGFEAREPQVDLTETTVFGPASLVNLVTSARTEISLADARATVQLEPALVPYSQDHAVEQVQLEPAKVKITVPIQASEGFSTISIRPDIRYRPPVGYTWQVESYEPETITVTGSQTRLNNMTDAVLTEPIDLRDRTETFETEVGVVLPPGVKLATDEQVKVRISIEAIEGYRQFDEIAVETRGLPAAFRAEVNPKTVTMLVTGPRPLLGELAAEDVSVVVDLQDLEPDTYQLALEPTIAIEGLNAGRVSLLPSVVTVQIVDTEAPTSTPTPTILTADTPTPRTPTVLTATPQP